MLVDTKDIILQADGTYLTPITLVVEELNHPEYYSLVTMQEFLNQSRIKKWSGEVVTTTEIHERIKQERDKLSINVLNQYGEFNNLHIDENTCITTGSSSKSWQLKGYLTLFNTNKGKLLKELFKENVKIHFSLMSVKNMDKYKEGYKNKLIGITGIHVIGYETLPSN